jgi:hypothetical protein
VLGEGKHYSANRINEIEIVSGRSRQRRASRSHKFRPFTKVKKATAKEIILPIAHCPTKSRNLLVTIPN